MKVSDKILEEMHNDMVDATNIAAAAITLAVQRSMDLRLPVQITLTTLKILVELNLQRSKEEHRLPKGARKLCVELGVEPDEASAFAHDELEKLIREWVSSAKLREEIIRS